MGKKQKKQSTYTTAETYKINKNKSFKANLNQYMKVLKAKHSNISTKEYINLIHRYISDYSRKRGPLTQSLVIQTTSKIKICKGCDKWAMGSKRMVGCGACQDYYHIQCAKDYDPKINWGCETCLKITNRDELEKSIRKRNQLPQCHKCDRNKNQNFVKCLKCANFYHKSCYGKTNVVCGTCDKNITSVIKLKQISLNQSFKRAQNSSYKKKNRQSKQLQKTAEKLQQSKIEVKSWSQPLDLKNLDFKKFKQQICQSSTASTIFSNNKRFVAGFPTMSPQQILNYKENLLFAIISKNMQYQQNLICHDCDLFDDNEDSLDFSLNHLSFRDTKRLHQYKAQPIGPFKLVYKTECGYDVIADKDLPKGMIVCEYVGDVYTHRQTLKYSNNDSIMLLKIGKNADQTLYIVPTHNTNIARFINGVNESDKDRKYKENVLSIRALVQGRPIVVLYTSRAIKKGQSLLYNYNAGGSSVQYDTTDYV